MAPAIVNKEVEIKAEFTKMKESYFNLMLMFSIMEEKWEKGFILEQLFQKKD